MKLNEEHRRKHQCVGRRTGIDIKAGKNIRKHEDGTENFDDYWTDSDTSRKEDDSSLTSGKLIHEDNQVVDTVNSLDEVASLDSPLQTFPVCPEINKASERCKGKLIVRNKKNASKQEDPLEGHNNPSTACYPRLEPENWSDVLNNGTEKKVSGHEDNLKNITNITVENLNCVNSSHLKDFYLLENEDFRISLTNKSKKHWQNESHRSLSNIKIQSKEIQMKKLLDSSFSNLKGENQLPDIKSFVDNSYKNKDHHASSLKSSVMKPFNEKSQEEVNKGSKNNLIKENNQNTPIYKTRGLNNSKSLVPLHENKASSKLLNLNENTLEDFNKVEALISINSSSVKKVEQKKRVQPKRNVSEKIQRKVPVRKKAQSKSAKKLQQLPSEHSVSLLSLHQEKVKGVPEKTPKSVCPLMKLLPDDIVNLPCSPPKKQRMSFGEKKSNTKTTVIKKSRSVVTKNKSFANSVTEQSSKESHNMNISNEEDSQLSSNKRTEGHNLTKQSMEVHKSTLPDKKIVTETETCSSKSKTFRTSHGNDIDETYNTSILLRSRSVMLSSELQKEDLGSNEQQMHIACIDKSGLSKRKKANKIGNNKIECKEVNNQYIPDSEKNLQISHVCQRTKKRPVSVAKSHNHSKQNQNSSKILPEENKRPSVNKMGRKISEKSHQKITKKMSSNFQDDLQIRSKNVQTLSEESIPELRRSCRTRMHPLDYWRNERILYTLAGGEYKILNIDPGFSGELINNKQQQQYQRTLTDAKKKTYKKKPVKNNWIKSEKNKSQIQSLPLNGGIILSQKKEMSADIIRSHHSLTWKGPSGAAALPADPVIISKSYCLTDIDTGLLKIRPLQEKPLQHIPDCDVIFFVVHGDIEVQVYETVWHLESNDTFIVPRGNVYRIKNLGNVEATVSFTSLKNEILQDMLL